MLFFVSYAPLALRASKSQPVCKRPSALTVRRNGATKMVLFDRQTNNITITGNNIHLTQSLQNYITEKLEKVSRRFGALISKMDVHLTVEQNPSVPKRHKAEVVAFAGKTILRTEVRTPDMYNSIDEVEERINRILRKFKERKERKDKIISKARRVTPDVVDDEDDDVYKDIYNEAPISLPAIHEVVKRKVFPMPLQTVEEAVLCCEYIDHPWYLFRNATTSEISLVYKRNHGGYGLIEPSNLNAVDDETIK